MTRTKRNNLTEHCKRLKVALVYKDFAYWTGYSSVGLQVAADTTCAELRRNGVDVQVFGLQNNVDLYHVLKHNQKLASEIHDVHGFTDCVIMAPWITPLDLEALAKYFKNIQFTVQSHCNVGALHGDFRGIGNFRNYADLAQEYRNIHIAGNAASFTKWFSLAYDVDTALLPNMYPAINMQEHNSATPNILHIGAFGALRPEKNIPSAVAAALLIQQHLQKQTYFHMNTGGEVGGKNLIATIDQISQGIPGFTVVKHPWMDWNKFTDLVKKMDLLMNPSYTESFNLITADGIVAGVPSVVSSAIRWAPKSWMADSDDPSDIAGVGLRLLFNKHSYKDGRDALIKHNNESVSLWKEYLYEGEVPDYHIHHEHDDDDDDTVIQPIPWYTRIGNFFRKTNESL